MEITSDRNVFENKLLIKPGMGDTTIKYQQENYKNL